MGKEKKGRIHRVGLAEDIIDDQTAKPQKQRSKQRKERQAEKDESYVEEKLSKKILEQARQQQDELEEEFGCGQGTKSLKTAQTSLGGVGSLDDDEDSGDEDSEDTSGAHYEQVEIAEEEEKAFEKFMSKEAPTRRTLADIIMEKINEKKTEIQSHMSERTSAPKMDERLVKVFRGVGKILKTYRSGKLPKAFRFIPSLTNWEDIETSLTSGNKVVMYLTEPDQWSAAAIYQGTRMFVISVNAKIAQRFFNLVLYPRIRDDIVEYKKLNYHLYMSLKKALFKPAAFFKGILLPLCEAGDCSLREAIIISSVLAKTSIPVLHSSAVILKIAEMNYSGANSIFLKTFFDKKYTLPYRVIDAVVYHFLRFLSDQRTLPVLWHQCLLTFVQRYKEDISSEQKDSLLDLCKIHMHSKITPEVRRELINSKCRDEETGLPMEDASY